MKKNDIINSVRLCKTNEDIYCILGELKAGWFNTYWKDIGDAVCHIDDIENDKIIGRIDNNKNNKSQIARILKMYKDFFSKEQ